MKRPVKIGLIVGGAIVLMVVTIVANVSRLHSTVRDVVVDIRHDDTPLLITEQTVKDTILASLPNLGGMRVTDVDRKKVAEAVIRVPELESAETSMSVSGKVMVKAKQRRPIVRMFYGNRELYMDANGAVFPTSKIADCNVLVAGGNFSEPLRKDSINSQVEDILKVAKFLDENKEYGQLIDQIYSQEKDEIMAVSKLGDNIIEIGSAENLNTKFSHLWSFYRNGMPRAGWNTYSKISLKFDGQVVCTKRKK